MDQNVVPQAEHHVSTRAEDIAQAAAEHRKRRLRLALFAAGGLAVLIAVTFYGHAYWTSGRFMVSTDDANLQADSVSISPEVAGYVAVVAVQDNEHVVPGQLLARIDDRDYRSALASAQANADAAAAGVDVLVQQMAQQTYAVSEAKAAVAGDQASLSFARSDEGRYAKLAQSGAGTVQAAQQSGTTAQTQRANLQRDTAAEGVAQTQMAVLAAQLVKARAESALAEASLGQARLNLGYTVITSPINGVIGERSLRVGQYVQAATQLMAVVPLQAVYVIANYKETQLTDVQPGQKVAISVDTFPDTVVHGMVNSVAPASGEEFALLPPDNATGNFTKIVQRVPVKITIDPHDPLLGELRPGMSVEPSINTKSRQMSGQGTSGAAQAEPTVPLKTWIAVGAALLGAFMAVLNIQVTNSSLPDIEGGIGTGGVNGTWISTSYLIGEIVVIPMTAFLSEVFSLRRYMIASTALFLIFSVACGQATSLPEMIILRGLQGFFGGVLIPMAFTIIVSMLPPAKRPMGFAGFAVTATFAPAIGPTIGGWLTDSYGWETVFYMNLVPGVLMLAGLIYALPASKPQHALLRHGDWIGIILMIIGLGTFQTILDDGNTDDWFGSPYIVKLSIISAITLSIFIALELFRKVPLVRLRLLRRRNFGLASFSNFMLGFCLYGAAYLLPQYLAVSQGFDAQQSGEVVAWTGLPQLLVIPFVPYLMSKIDPRLLVGAGTLIFAASCFMNVGIDPNVASPQLLVPDVIRAIGQALVMVPISAVAMVGITNEEAGDASGLFNMLRSLGGAIGTAAVETFFTKREQYHSFIINAHVSLYDPATQTRLAALQHYFLANGSVGPASAMARAINVVGVTINAQATVMGYADCFGLLGAILVVSVASIALLKRGASAAGGAH